MGNVINSWYRYNSILLNKNVLFYVSDINSFIICNRLLVYYRKEIIHLIKWPCLSISNTNMILFKYKNSKEQRDLFA